MHKVQKMNVPAEMAQLDIPMGITSRTVVPLAADAFCQCTTNLCTVYELARPKQYLKQAVM